MTNVAILGAAGRMGCAIMRCARRAEDVRVVAAIEQAGNAAIGKDAGLAAGIEATGIAIGDNLRDIGDTDVLIDFTFHAAVAGHVAAAAEMRRAMVIGTTGLTEDELTAVRVAAARIPIVHAPNMSLGVNLLFALTARAAKVLGMSYDAEIIEIHHHHKKDAPSGTALRLAEKVAEGRGQDFGKAACYGRQGLPGERPDGEIGVHAVRGGDVIGDHTVLFAGEGERVELSHRVTSRDALALGALHAAKWVVSRRPGLYDMQNVLGL